VTDKSNAKHNSSRNNRGALQRQRVNYCSTPARKVCGTHDWLALRVSSLYAYLNMYCGAKVSSQRAVHVACTLCGKFWPRPFHSRQKTSMDFTLVCVYRTDVMRCCFLSTG